jgi:hypothetical protein
MSTYLTRLKQLENEKNSHYMPNTVPPKPAKAPFGGFDGTGSGHIEKKIIHTDIQLAQVKSTDNPLSESQEAAIMGWLISIGETDKACRDEVLDKCRDNTEALAYYLAELTT